MTDSLVDARPYSYSVAGACQAFGLSRSRLWELLREDKIARRYDGAKVLVLGDSLRQYIDSLPSERSAIENAPSRERRGIETTREGTSDVRPQ